MTSFEDGPAKGQLLNLFRAAIFLRVVESGGKWDALDQPDDVPRPEEKIYAYQCLGVMGSAFIDGRDQRGRRTGYRSMIASYRFVEDQPTDVEMRSTVGWHKWCEAHDPRPTEGKQ